MLRPRSSAAFSLAMLALAATPVGCSGDDGPQGVGGGDASTTHPDAPPLPGQTECTVVVHAGIDEPDREHLDPCTPITYATPPSGGNHWPIWATYEEHHDVLPREMYVHNLEHGAIVLTYACDGCDDVKQAYRDATSALADPLCLQTVGGPKARIVITADPLLETPIAMSAWGATYTATCIDPPSIAQFITDHYGLGPEQLCADGYAPPTCE